MHTFLVPACSMPFMDYTVLYRPAPTWYWSSTRLYRMPKPIPMFIQAKTSTNTNINIVLCSSAPCHVIWVPCEGGFKVRPYEPLAGLTLCEPSYKDMAYSLGLVLDLVFSSRSFCCCVAVLLLRDPGSGNRGRTLDSMIFGFAQVYGTSCLHCICIWARLQGCFSASCFSTWEEDAFQLLVSALGFRMNKLRLRLRKHRLANQFTFPSRVEYDCPIY